MTEPVATAIAGFLACQDDLEVLAALIYGSVATGRATPDSDIDCLVVVSEDPVSSVGARVRAEFADLQQRLGYTPDPEYPIELFGLEACRTLLRSSTYDAAATGQRPQKSAAADPLDDAAELLHALTSPRIAIIDSQVLAELTGYATSTHCEAREEHPVKR